MQVKRKLNGRCAPVQWESESPRVVRRTAPSNTRIKLTAKLKSLKAFSLLAAYPPPIRRMPMAWRIKMNRTLCLKILYGIILISLGTIVYWTISNTSKDYRLVSSLFIGLLLLIPGRISQYFYQDFYTGRKYMNKSDLDKALYHFLQFERCIEEKA